MSFACYYCGECKPDDQRSDEHIIPSCIGGSRNVTLTNEVCASCNQWVGDHVDRPFCRDWVIESAKLTAGIGHRGKRPVTFMGRISWARPEPASLYLLEGGAAIAAIENQNGEQVLAVLVDEADVEMVDSVRKTIRDRFAGCRIINGPTRSPYDDELAQSFIALGGTIQLRLTIDLQAWQPEIAKMGLGLGCQALGAPFVHSEGAQRLRQFIRQQDRTIRDQMQMFGRGGAINSSPQVTQYFRPNENQHMFILTVVDQRVWFVANFFNKYENTLLLHDGGEFAPVLGDQVPGLVWLIDPKNKVTRGPLPLYQAIAESIRDSPT